MKKSFPAFVFVIVSISGFSQKADVLFKADIPDDWEVLDEQHGDLNKDSIADAAVIIQEKGEGTGDDGKKRTLMVFFKGKDGIYKLIQSGRDAIIGDQGGGTLGDPFVSMKITKGVIVLDFSGGSREQWSLTYRYRYQNGDFFLIGATNKGSDGIKTYSCDYNLSSGKMIIVENKKTTTRVDKKNLLPKLSSFKPWSMSFGNDISF